MIHYCLKTNKYFFSLEVGWTNLKTHTPWKVWQNLTIKISKIMIQKLNYSWSSAE
jgi:hypothetical protein